MSINLQAYKGLAVAKVFPGHGEVPFKGTVTKVDGRDKKTPIFITYDDGDAEWMSHKELLTILVDKPAAFAKTSAQAAGPSKKRARGNKSTDSAPPAAASAETPSSKKQKKNSSTAAAAPAAADAAGTSAAAAAAVDVVDGFDAEKVKRGLKHSDKAANGMTQFTLTAGGKAAQRAAAAGAKDAAAAPASSDGSDSTQKDAAPSVRAAAAAGGDKGAGSSGGAAAAAAGTGRRSAIKAAAPASPAPHLPQLLTEINKQAGSAGAQLAQDLHVARLPYRSSGATMLPAMSQAVVAAGQCHLSLYSTRKSGSLTPGRGLFDNSDPDYQSETEALLHDLDKLLDHSGSNKTMLLTVRVTLRNMTDGLPGFKAAWDAWVDRSAAPVVTLLEGAGPFTNSNITLEVSSLTKPSE